MAVAITNLGTKGVKELVSSTLVIPVAFHLQCFEASRSGNGIVESRATSHLKEFSGGEY